MAEIELIHKSYVFTPASYSADETRTVTALDAGDMVWAVYTVVDVAFDGTGGRSFKFGTAGTNGLFSDTSDVTITSAATTPVEGVGAAGRFANVGRYMVTANNTALNIYFTAATGGGPTVGKFTLHYIMSRRMMN